MAQLYINDLTFTKVYPMKLKSQTAETLSTFIHDVGIPTIMHSDDANELIRGKFRLLCKDYGITSTFTEPYSPWQNRAEGGICELKRNVHRKMKAKHVPHKLWDFCCCWSCNNRNKTSSSLYSLDGRAPYEAVMGHTPNISSLLPLDFYEPIWYYDQMADFPTPKRKIARSLGEAYDFGQSMCYWILPESGVPIVRSMIQSITTEKWATEEVQLELTSLDNSIKRKLGDPHEDDSVYTYDLNDPDVNNDEIPEHITPEFSPVEPEASMPEADDWDARLMINIFQQKFSSHAEA
jgi:hypothetical protein